MSQSVPPQPAPTVPPGPPVGYGAAPPGRKAKKLLLMVLAGCVLLAGVVMVALLPALLRARDEAGARRCAHNLARIGLGIQMYANASGGAFPDTIDRLITAQAMTADDFVCPHSSDTPAPGATPQAQAAKLSAGGHLSYVYLGKGMSEARLAKPADVVVAYEPLTNHGNGIYVLFADGRVEFMNAAQARQLIADVQAGKNPPGVKAAAPK